jgi:putative FmdB family regulatory protein
VPIYEFRCKVCGSTFEERRPMAQADEPAPCPQGHLGATRLLPVFATVGSAGPPAQGCGSGCACFPQ